MPDLLTSQKKKPGHAELCEMSNEHLAYYCLDNYRPAWNEFFLRFIPCLKNSIRKTLNNAGQYRLAKQYDIIEDIHLSLVMKLYKEGALKHCGNLAEITPWLKTMARHQTIDWLRARGRIKRLPKRQSEAATTSLSEPVSTESDKTIGDYVLGQIDHSFEFIDKNEKKGMHAEYIIDKINQIVKPKKKWIIRLCLIAYAPLSEDEVEDIILFCPLSRCKALELLDGMMKDVKKKEHKKEENKNKAILYLYEILRIESLLGVKEKSQQTEDQPEIAHLREKLKKKRKNRGKFLTSSRKISRPYSKDIAKLIGLPDDKVGQITNIFNRGCEELTKMDLEVD